MKYSLIFILFLHFSLCGYAQNQFTKNVTINVTGLSPGLTKQFKDAKVALCNSLEEYLPLYLNKEEIKQMFPIVINVSYSSKTGGCIQLKTNHRKQSFVSNTFGSCAFLQIPLILTSCVINYRNAIWRTILNPEILDFIAMINIKQYNTSNYVTFWAKNSIESISIYYYGKYNELTGKIYNATYCPDKLVLLNGTKTPNYYFFKFFGLKLD